MTLILLIIISALASMLGFFCFYFYKNIQKHYQLINLFPQTLYFITSHSGQILNISDSYKKEFFRKNIFDILKTYIPHTKNYTPPSLKIIKELQLSCKNKLPYQGQIKTTQFPFKHFEQKNIYLLHIQIMPLSKNDMAWSIEEVSHQENLFNLYREKSHIYEKILSNFPLAFILFDAQKKILFINKIAQKYIQLSLDELDKTFISHLFSSKVDLSQPTFTTFLKTPHRDIKINCYTQAIKEKTLLVFEPFSLMDNPFLKDDWFEHLPFGLCILNNQYSFLYRNTLFKKILQKDEKTFLDFFDDNLAHKLQGHLSQNTPHHPLKLQSLSRQTLTIYHTKIDDIIYVFLHPSNTSVSPQSSQFTQNQKLQAMGQLAGGLAHDFNNLLTALLGHSDILLNSIEEDDPMYNDINQIHQNLNRATRLVHQLLAFSRKQPLKTKIISASNEINAISSIIHRLLGERVSLSFEPPPYPLYIQVDPGQFSQIFINFAINARDSIKTIKGFFKISIQEFHSKNPKVLSHNDEILPAGHYVCITSQDNGTGMPPDIFPYIFEPFFTTKTNPSETGTGLGLATVYGIVNQNGGYIHVSSSSQGTDFSIYFPIAETPMHKPAVSVPNAPIPFQMNMHQKKILIIEDDENVRRLIVKFLSKKGYITLEAASAEQGEDLLNIPENIPHLIITDMIMSGITGLELSKKIYHQHPHIKFILISGYSDEIVQGNIPETLPLSFMAKPFQIQELFFTIQKILND